MTLRKTIMSSRWKSRKGLIGEGKEQNEEKKATKHNDSASLHPLICLIESQIAQCPALYDEKPLLESRREEERAKEEGMGEQEAKEREGEESDQEEDDYDQCDGWDDAASSSKDADMWERLHAKIKIEVEEEGEAMSVKEWTREGRRDSIAAVSEPIACDSRSNSGYDYYLDTYESEWSMSTDSEDEEEEEEEEREKEEGKERRQDDMDLPIPPFSLPIPHWWGSEDSDHTREVMDYYTKKIGVEEERKRSVRSAPPFIGRIIRYLYRCSDSRLSSLDSVSTYRYDMVPFGHAMPRSGHCWVRTEWDASSGLPLSISPLSSSQSIRLWALIQHQASPVALFCEPNAAAPREFVFSSCLDRARDLTAPLGYHQPSAFLWGAFFPERVSRCLPHDLS